jgi:chemotaxis protein histidine kinase CheA
MAGEAPVEGTPVRSKRSYVLPLAIVLVLGQIAAFVAIKMSKDDPEPAKPPVVAGTDPAVGATDPPTAPPPPVVNIDAAVAPTPTTDPPTTGDPPPVTDPPPIVEPVKPDDDNKRIERKKETAREKLARERQERLERERQEKAEREREKAERERADRERREEEKRLAEQRKLAEAEKQRAAAEAEKVRQEAEKARAEAEAEKARLEAERIKAEAAKQIAAAPKGSPNVLVLVLGPGVSGASREAIRNVYLGKTSVWPNGTTARPMNRPSGSAAGRKFFGGVLGMSGGEFKEHWSSLQLSGGGIAPSTISSAETMVAKVAATRGGIGYVLESELPSNTSGVKLVPLK